MSPLRPLLACVTLALLTACHMTSETPAPSPGDDSSANTVRIGSIDWLVDYDEAARLAQSSDRPLWLHFGENPG